MSLSKTVYHWNPEVEKLLLQWTNELLVLEKLHKKKGMLYKKINITIGISNLLLISGLLVSTINILLGSTHHNIFIMQLLFEIFGLIVSSLDYFINFSSTSEKHINSSNHYENLSRLIYSTLTIKKNSKINPERF